MRKNMALGLVIVVMTVAGNGVHMAKSAKESGELSAKVAEGAIEVERLGTVASAASAALRAEAALAAAQDRDSSIRAAVEWSESWAGVSKGIGGGDAKAAAYGDMVAQAMTATKAGDTQAARDVAKRSVADRSWQEGFAKEAADRSRAAAAQLAKGAREAVAEQERLASRGALIAFATMGICLATLFATGRAVTVPLARLTREVEAMTDGKRGFEVDPESLPSEFGPLARRLSRMKAELAVSEGMGPEPGHPSITHRRGSQSV